MNKLLIPGFVLLILLTIIQNVPILKKNISFQLSRSTNILGVQSNTIKNPEFDADFANWAISQNPTTASGTSSIDTSGCYSGKCLKLTHGSATAQTAIQAIGSLQPNQTYELSGWSKTINSHFSQITLYTANWNRTCDAFDGKSFSKVTAGINDWQKSTVWIYIPAIDDCGESTGNFQWGVYLYSHFPLNDPSPVWYDQIEFGLTNSTTPPKYSELEEQSGWNIFCQIFNSTLPLTSCHQGVMSTSTIIKKSGNYSVALKGMRQSQEFYNLDLLVKPNTTYKASLWAKITDRKTFNYLGLDYPIVWTQQRPNISDSVDYTKGIWSGDYEISVNGERINQPSIKDAPYRSASDIDWFPLNSYFKTRPDQQSISISAKLSGYEGNFYLDGITLEEVASHIDDHYFHIPISQEFEGMKIVGVTQNPLSVRTNAAEFRFGSSTITQLKDTVVVGTITAKKPLFSGLTVKQEQGSVVLENSNVLISIGSDSVLLVKLKINDTLAVSGSKPGYHNFEAGVLFVTDYTRGMLFSPLRTRQELLSIPRQVNPKNFSVIYSDAEIAKKGMKYWNVISDFINPTWNIEYTFNSGDGFVSQVFPPKTFNEQNYCKNNLTSANIDINKTPQANYDYVIQNQKKWGNIVLIWMNNYESVNTQNPPEEYCTDQNGLLVSCTSVSVANRFPTTYKFDVIGPYTISQKTAIKNIVEKSHAKGMKVIVYMSPQYYFTYDVDRFLTDLQGMVTEYNIDGVYYDGIFEGDALKTLELVRKTRNLLGEKFYVQHNSWAMGLLTRTSNFRNPFEDAYADLIWLGEGIKQIDQDTWRLNYCGQNVSNTVSQLLSEMRPVDYSLNDASASMALTLSPEEQINNSLSCNGLYRMSAGDVSRISDKRYGTSIPFDTDFYVDKVRAMCLPKICGDNICDTIETIANCSKDCAPVTTSSTLSKQGASNICTVPDTVGQWVINNNPFYLMHYTFDGSYATDASGNGLIPSINAGVSVQTPQFVSIDNQRVAYFSSNQVINGPVYKKFNFTNKPFSSFAKIKKEGNDTANQGIFYLLSDAGGQSFYYSINNNKIFFWSKDGQNIAKTFTGRTTITPDTWYTLGFVYNNNRLTVYLNGAIEIETPLTMGTFTDTGNFYIGASNPNGLSAFKGYIDDIFVTDKVITSEQVNQYAQNKLATATFDTNENVKCLVETNGKFMTAVEDNNPPGIPGDANGDTKVDGIDYVIWLKNYNTFATGPQKGDFNSNGKVDGIDYVIWLTHLLK